ncbi:putative The fantastic four family protein [Helianthus annuus]|nr:putative The fantastic four family protein [Helianthus annuus]
MAACKSLQPILDHPLDPSPPLFSSCKHITPTKPIDGSPTDVFSGFNIHEKSDSIISPDHSSESLSEALGFESFDDVEDFNDEWEERHESVIKHAKTKISVEPNRSRISGKEIPPPISSIGRRVCFKSYRYNGRLVLKEEKIQTQDILHAYREDGRLKLQFIQSDDDVEPKQENEVKSDNGNDIDDGNH